MNRQFPGLNVQVRPHTSSPVAPPLTTRPTAGRAIRIGLIGAIGEHKGFQVLLACARDAQRRRLPLEFVVIGYTEHDSRLLATGKVGITGRYTDGEVPYLLERQRLDALWLPSVWPETWCYTLDHALASGLPIAAFELGAVAERLQAAGTGVLMPLSLQAAQINERLLGLVSRSSRARTGLATVESPLPPAADDVKIAAPQSAEIAMPQIPDGARAQEASDEALSASVQVLPLPAGLYLFSVQAASPATSRSNGLLSLPAVHVGLGPGVRAEQVQFIEGPSTQGAWLFSQGDLLIAKVSPGATLILTSMRAPSGEVLSIKVERLESRVEGLIAAARPAIQPAAAAAGPSAAETGVVPPGTPLPVRIGTHIRARGDLSFAEVPWAGRIAPGLWIESFSVQPLERLAAHDVEYKGLTGSGFETPWLSDGQMCGTKGMAVPLVGFAIRLKPGPATAPYTCEYSGYFQSGVIVGPLRSGAPCRSTVANDPLEGIQVRLIERTREAVSPIAARPSDETPSTPPADRRRAARLPTRPVAARAARRPSSRRS